MMAEVTGLSESRFAALYKQLFDVPPAGDLLDMRIKHAMTLLHHTQQPLSALAEACGFCNEFHFSRMFKKYIGQSPGKFRKDINK